jgi:hypothetical protein
VHRLTRLFIVSVLCLHLFLFINLRARITIGYPDFTAFYAAAKIIRNGFSHQLYDSQAEYDVQKDFTGQIPSRRGALPYIHPPFEALIFLPFTLLSYSKAFLLWDLLNLAGLFIVTLLLRQSVSTLRMVPLWEFVIGSLAFFPIFACFLQGQDSILLLLLCTLGFNALKKKADLLAGSWFAFGAFKFQWVVPLVLLFVIWKRRKVGVGFLVTAMFLTIVSGELVGWRALLHYPEYILQIARFPHLGNVPPELMPNLRGLAFAWPLSASRIAGSIVTSLSSLTLFFLAATSGWKSYQPQRIELQFSLAVVVSGLTGWHTNSHDLSLLLLPVVLITDYCVHTVIQQPLNKFALMLPALPVLISPLWIVLWLAWGRVNLMAIPLVCWAWKIGRELSRERSLHPSTAVAVEPSG